jgi:hypothetical protein
MITHSYLQRGEQDLDTDDGFIYEDNDAGNDSQSSQALKVKRQTGSDSATFLKIHAKKYGEEEP